MSTHAKNCVNGNRGSGSCVIQIVIGPTVHFRVTQEWHEIHEAINGLKLSPNCSPGPFSFKIHSKFIQILHQICMVSEVENGYILVKLNPTIILSLQL